MAEAALTQRILVMSRGCVCLDGAPREIFARAEELKKIGLQLPQITELFIRLKASGFPVHAGIVTIEDALQQVISIAVQSKD